MADAGPRQDFKALSQARHHRLQRGQVLAQSADEGMAADQLTTQADEVGLLGLDALGLFSGLVCHALLDGRQPAAQRCIFFGE